MVQVMNMKIESVFIAKGIAISLVVIGHYNPANAPDYWIKLQDVIYTFHMPVFFMLSGYLYGLSHNKYSGYTILIKQKSNRLLIPFITISIFYLIVKSIAGIFFNLIHPVNLTSIINNFINPYDSYASIVWFIYTLFLIFSIYPILQLLLINNTIVTLAIFALYFIIPQSNYFCLSLMFNNLPAFSIGFIVGIHKINIDLINIKYLWIIFIICIVLFTITYIFNRGLLGPYQKLSVDLLCYIFGSIGCISLSGIIYLFKYYLVWALKAVGQYSMSIFLFHNIFVGIVRIISDKIGDNHNSLFIYEAFIAVSLGIIVPLLIEKYFIRKHLLIRKLFLGIN